MIDYKSFILDCLLDELDGLEQSIINVKYFFSLYHDAINEEVK